MWFDPWSRSEGRGSSVAVIRGVGCRYSLDPTLLWLWCRLAAIAPIGPLAWELPYATGDALKKNAGSYDGSIFNFFLDISILFSMLAAPVYILTNSP